MVNKKYFKVIFAFCMALIMSGIMSLVISIYNVGLVNNIVTIWFSAWAFVFSLAFPIIFSISPLVHRMVSMATEEAP